MKVRWPLAVLACVGVAWLWSVLGTYNVVADIDTASIGLGPRPGHWLGTDRLGRDVLRRLARATEAFVAPGVASAAVAIAAGTLLGSGAGWWAGPGGRGLRFIATLPATIPRFVLVLLLATIFTPSTAVFTIGCALAFAPTIANTVANRVRAAREDDAVAAGLVHGLSTWRVLGVHILWSQCRRQLAALGLEAFAFYVVVETTLAYLGDLGVQEPEPSWGNMIASGLLDDRLHPVARLAPAVCLWGLLVAIHRLRSELRDDD